MIIRHIDLVVQDLVYANLSAAENYWHSMAESIMDGAPAHCTLHVAEKYQAECRNVRLAYLQRRGITLGEGK